MISQKLIKAREVGDYDDISFCQLYIILADEEIAALSERLRKAIENAEHDRAAYNLVLGSTALLPCEHDGKLSDGTEPVNITANKLAEILYEIDRRGLAGEELRSNDPVYIKNGYLYKALKTDS